MTDPHTGARSGGRGREPDRPSTAARGPAPTRRSATPSVVSQDPAAGHWTAWVGIHEAATEDELMEWINRNVPVEWTGRGVGWASPSARPPRRG